MSSKKKRNEKTKYSDILIHWIMVGNGDVFSAERKGKRVQFCPSSVPNGIFEIKHKSLQINLRNWKWTWSCVRMKITVLLVCASFALPHFACFVSVVLHHFGYETIFFSGSSLSISENFKMHYNILAPVGWFHLIRQTTSRHIHSPTHDHQTYCTHAKTTMHCMYRIAYRGFISSRHSFCIRANMHTAHGLTCHRGIYAECAVPICTNAPHFIQSSEIGTDSLQWKLWLHFSQFHEMRASLKQLCGASLKFASKIGIRTMMHTNSHTEICRNRHKHSWQKVLRRNLPLFLVHNNG